MNLLQKKVYLSVSKGGNIGKYVLLHFKNNMWFTKSGDNCVFFADIWLPAFEKSHSLKTNVAGIARYFQTNCDRMR